MSAKVWCCAPEGRAPLQTQFSMALIPRMQRGSIQSFFEVCFAKTRSVVGRVVFSLPGVFGRMDGGARWTGRPTQLLSVVERHARRTAYGAFVTHAPGGARAVHDRALPARLTPAHESGTRRCTWQVAGPFFRIGNGPGPELKKARDSAV